MGKSTIYDILREKDRWLSSEPSESQLKRARVPKFSALEEALFTWFGDMRSRGAVVSDDMLIEKARTYGTALGKQNSGLLDTIAF